MTMTFTVYTDGSMELDSPNSYALKELRQAKQGIELAIKERVAKVVP